MLVLYGDHPMPWCVIAMLSLDPRLTADKECQTRAWDSIAGVSKFFLVAPKPFLGFALR